MARPNFEKVGKEAFEFLEECLGRSKARSPVVLSAPPPPKPKPFIFQFAHNSNYSGNAFAQPPPLDSNQAAQKYGGFLLVGYTRTAPTSAAANRFHGRF